MPSDDLKTYATSTTDFYTLLGVTFETSQRDIDRAWRKTALKYHPDKVGNDPVAREKFHLAQIGYDILSSPAIKVLYDNARTARIQKQRQNELFEGKRRKMKEDLEAREQGVKRGRDEEEGDEEKFERELRRLAEDGKRRRKEREEMLKKDVLQEQMMAGESVSIDAAAIGPDQHNGSINSKLEPAGVSEIDRTVKVRWPREGTGNSMDKDQLKDLFSKFGKIENVFLLKDKKQKVGAKREKKVVATGVIIFESVVGAHAAVEDFKKELGVPWEIIDFVYWAANKEPDFVSGHAVREDSIPGSTPVTPVRTGGGAAFSWQDGDAGSSPQSASSKVGGPGLRQVPSFASFSSAAFHTPNGSPSGKNGSAGSPSLEEITMIRLKNAEKKRLEAEIQRQDEEAAAAEGK
ncbi:hypothetical protein MMC09_003190 [Bachmanniomyces sp. S44760]|nr:hypothetical protein [Bachmanniomyces sp. S44760]